VVEQRGVQRYAVGVEVTGAEPMVYETALKQLEQPARHNQEVVPKLVGTAEWK